MKKLFLVELECAEDTRFFCTDKELTDPLRVVCEGAARVWSRGTEPKAKVLMLVSDEAYRIVIDTHLEELRRHIEQIAKT
jgi:hypothetical protein